MKLTTLLLLLVVLLLCINSIAAASSLKDVNDNDNDDDDEDDEDEFEEEEGDDGIPVNAQGEIEAVVDDAVLARFANLTNYPVHYRGFHIYRGFSLEKAIITWQQQDISINYFDPIRGRLFVSGKVNLWERSISSIVKELCSVLIDEQMKSNDASAWLRCAVPATQTVRLRVIQVIANISQWYEYAPFEEEIFAYVHAFESPIPREGMSLLESAQSPLAGHACLLGNPTPHVVLSMLTSPLISKISVFSRQGKASSFVKSDLPPRDLNWDTVEALNAARLFNKTYNLQSYTTLLEEYWKYRNSNIGAEESQLAHVCDYIAITPDILPSATGRDDYAESIVPLVKFLSQVQNSDYKNDKTEKVYIARIIWQTMNPHHQKQRNPASKHIDWKLSSTWFHSCYFGNSHDKNGFYDIHYGTWQTKKPFKFSVIQIGYFKNQNDFLPRPDGPPPVHEKDFVIILITATIRMFIDNSFALQTQLNELGYRNVLILSEMTIQLYDTYEAIAKQIGARIIHVLLTPMDLAFIGKYNIIYNTEHFHSPILFNEGEERYKHLLSYSFQIWHFFEQGSKELQEKFQFPSGSEGGKVTTVPFMYSTNRLTTLMSMNITKAVDPFADFSVGSTRGSFRVIFIGGCTTRRLEALDTLLNEVRKRNTAKRHIHLFNFCGTYIFDYERDFYLVNSHVVINLSGHSESSLETHRVNYMLSLGKIVVSEEGNSKSLTDNYRDGVIFVKSVLEMVDMLSLLANDQEFYDLSLRKVESFYSSLYVEGSQKLESAMAKAHVTLFGL